MKLSNLGRLKQPRGNNEGEEGDMGESSSSSEDEGEEGGEGERPGGNSRKPIMQVFSMFPTFMAPVISSPFFGVDSIES